MKISLEIFIDDMKVNETVIPELSTKPAIQEDKLACKARRFLLWDESANCTEGVLWGSGYVTDELMHIYKDWEEFKERNPGSGVQWIDQEVAE